MRFRWKQRSPQAQAPVAPSRASRANPEAGQRRRRQFLTAGRSLLLAVVVLAPEAAAWQGLLALARDTFGMRDGLELLVPLLFGAAAMYVALLAVRYVLDGDSAFTERALTWIYAVAGAGFNWWHAEKTGSGTAAAIFFAGASLSAALLWDRTLRAWRRDELRAAGALEKPLPRFRALRWFLAPAQTFTGFRAAVVQGLTTPEEALAAAEQIRGEIQARRAAAAAAAAESKALVERELAEIEGRASAPALEVEPPVAEIAEPTHAAASDKAVERRTPISSLSMAAAVREAWAALHFDGLPTTADTEQILTWLHERGRTDIDAKYVREVRLREEKKLATPSAQRPHLSAVGGA